MQGGSERQPVSHGEPRQSEGVSEATILITRNLTAFNLVRVRNNRDAIGLLEAERKVRLHGKATSKLRGDASKTYEYGLLEKKIELGIEKWTQLGYHVEDMTFPPEGENYHEGLEQLHSECFDGMPPEVQRAIEGDVERWAVGDEYALQILATYDKPLADGLVEEAKDEMHFKAYSKLSDRDKSRVDRSIAAYYRLSQQAE